MIAKAVLAAEAREAARKAKALLRDRKGILAGGGLPGKLRDCTSKVVERCELYLVEGDSAGGSAEGGRDREFQAILPLRGKIINAYKSREDKVLANEEVRSMISAIGCGIGEEVDLSKRRYGKVIIMTDADVDGSHIRTLLLTFFYRQMYDLVRGGHVYVAQPPLFKITHKKQTYYVQTEAEMNGQLLESGLKDAVFEPGDGRTIAGAEMERLCRTLSALEDSLVALERRGISLRAHAVRQDPATGQLPIYHVFIGHGEHWFASRKTLDEFIARQEQESGNELKLSDEAAPAAATPRQRGEADGQPDGNGHPGSRLHIVEFHEVRSINSQLAELRKMGFEIDSLIPQERTGMEEPRYRAPPRREHGRAGRSPRPAGRRPQRRREGDEGHAFQGSGGNGPRGAARHDHDPGQPHALASHHGRRRRRRRPVPHPHGRQGRAPPRVHREARAGGAESAFVPHAVRQDPATGQLPIYHVFIGHGEHWFASRKTLDEFIAQQEQESGDELKLSDEAGPATATPEPGDPTER